MSDQAGAGERESVFDRASRIARERQAEADRLERLESPEAGQAVRTELETLVRLLIERGDVVRERLGVTGGVDVGPSQQWAVQFAGLSTTIQWENNYANTVRYGVLRVRGWNRNHSFAGYTTGEQTPASERNFEFDVVGNAWVWRESSRGARTDTVVSTADLADDILHELITRWETPPDQRESYRAVRW
jgi:hypothetical protein